MAKTKRRYLPPDFWWDFYDQGSILIEAKYKNKFYVVKELRDTGQNIERAEKIVEDLKAGRMKVDWKKLTPREL